MICPMTCSYDHILSRYALRPCDTIWRRVQRMICLMSCSHAHMILWCAIYSWDLFHDDMTRLLSYDMHEMIYHKTHSYDHMNLWYVLGSWDTFCDSITRVVAVIWWALYDMPYEVFRWYYNMHCAHRTCSVTRWHGVLAYDVHHMIYHMTCSYAMWYSLSPWDTFYETTCVYAELIQLPIYPWFPSGRAIERSERSTEWRHDSSVGTLTSALETTF